MNAETFRLRRHDRIERMLHFDLRLVTRTGLHIGAGKNAGLASSDLPVMRDAEGWPLVPGSSLRGRLRAAIASLIDALGLDRARPRPEPTEDELVKAWQTWSLVERLFGRVPMGKNDGLAYGSRLQFSDLLCERADEADLVPIELRDGVGISRETRTAGMAIKYDLEVVPAGTVFRGKVRFLNPADYEIGLVAQALAMLDDGLLLLGGKSARGLGWVAVSVTPPVAWSARALLEGTQSPQEEAFGPVPNHFAAGLESLRELARSVSPPGGN